MKYLFLFLLVFTSGAAVATNLAVSINSRPKPAIDARNITLPIPGSAPAIIKKPNTGRRRRPPRAMAMRWRCWRSSKSVTPQQADYPQARQLAEKAVEAGSKSGEIVLARVLVNRQAGATDVAHAITLLQDAARDSESDAAVDAQMLLGLIYASGVHGPEDDVKASEYFKGSSSLSRTGYAEYWAGMMFQQGEKGFIEPNKQKALHWLNVSCLEGFDTGCEEFDRISKG